MTHGCCVDGACTPETCMELPTGMTCYDCCKMGYCEAWFGKHKTDTACDWFPREFRLSIFSPHFSIPEGKA